MRLWHCGIVALWHCGIVALWHCGIVALGDCGIGGLWHCGIDRWMRTRSTISATSSGPAASPTSLDSCSCTDLLTTLRRWSPRRHVPDLCLVAVWLLSGRCGMSFDLVVSQARALGGNAVLGYQQHFDFEGDSGVVARAYGTVFRSEMSKLPVTPIIHVIASSSTQHRVCLYATAALYQHMISTRLTTTCPADWGHSHNPPQRHFATYSRQAT